MKEKWLRAGKIALIVLGVLLFLFLIGFGRCFIAVWEIDRITMKACDEQGTKTVELTDGEVFGFAAIYALSRHAGTVTAEGCDHMFDIDIYMKDGTCLSITDDQSRGHQGVRMKVYGTEYDSFWVDNVLLVEYIKILVHNHGLHWDTFSHCC